ncbi:DUF2334 domain-containing protein [[Clostridium] dakarense]|uniref:DUF2334 domain-containing protein n=1 Tax=Faecalimicrobium dakarense TaxID=1301100 RepID=UPI0004B075FF|nr:DUF2334 domain-containing protein [[Clostridium] dakarense]
MSAKYLFRLDDICENMNWDNFNKLKEIFIKNDIKPIIGVIPKNTDKKLLKYDTCNIDFWDEIKKLQDKENWSIALHGFNHHFETRNSGILGINNRSEFAGLSKEVQNIKIKEGKNILNHYGINSELFMAPAHSFDETTLECLKENEINIITDGYSLWPYYEYDMLFIPQLFASPRKMPFGIYTWCIHLNAMSTDDINSIKSFIENNKENIISFKNIINYKSNFKSNKIIRLLLQKLLIIIRRIKNKNSKVLNNE